MWCNGWCTPERLGKLGLFYATYYTFLYVLFKTSLYAITLRIPDRISSSAPQTQKTLYSPAMNIVPISQVIEGTYGKTNWINRNGQDMWSYKDEMDKFIEYYSESAKIAPTIKTCSSNNTASKDAQCKPYDNLDFIKEWCGENYGYIPKAGNPCFVVGLNRIINWQMKGLTDIAKLPSGSPNGYAKDHTYFGCEVFKLQEDMKVTYADRLTSNIIEWHNGSFSDGVDMTDRENAIPSYFYPFTGNSKLPDYQVSKGYLDTKTDLRFRDPNWLKPFRVMKIKLDHPSLDGVPALHFECNAFCDNCLYTELGADNTMKFPEKFDLSRSSTNQGSQMIFTLVLNMEEDLDKRKS